MAAGTGVEDGRPSLRESCAESRVVISGLDEVASHAWYESHDVARSGLGYLHVHGASVEDEPQTARFFRPDITLLDVDRNRLTETPVSRLRETTDDDGSDSFFAYDEPPSATNWAELTTSSAALVANVILKWNLVWHAAAGCGRERRRREAPPRVCRAL